MSNFLTLTGPRGRQYRLVGQEMPGGNYVAGWHVTDADLRVAGWVPVEEVEQLREAATKVLLAFEESIMQAHEAAALDHLDATVYSGPQPSRDAEASEGEKNEA